MMRRPNAKQSEVVTTVGGLGMTGERSLSVVRIGLTADEVGGASPVSMKTVRPIFIAHGRDSLVYR